jgi:hypothetical protein
MNNVLAKKYIPNLSLEEFIDECKPFVQEYSCPLCEGILYNSVIDRCGHSFCKDCLEILLRDTKFCLFSNVEIKEVTNNTVLNNVIEKQRIFCKNKTKCEWIGKLSERKNHLIYDCAGELNTCDFLCGGEYTREEMASHKLECLMRVINCHHCDEFVKFVELEEHYKSCSNIPIPCSCGLNIASSRMKLHLDSYCEVTATDCPFSAFGCAFYEIRRNLKSHLDEHLEDHLKLVAGRMRTLEDMINMSKKEITSLQNENIILKNEIKKAYDTNDEFKKDITKMFNELNLKINKMSDYSIVPISNYLPRFEKVDDNIISINNNRISKVIDNTGWYGISSLPIKLTNDKTIINSKLVNTSHSCVMIGITYSNMKAPLEKGFYQLTETEDESYMFYCFNSSIYNKGRAGESSKCMSTNDIVTIIIDKTNSELSFRCNGSFIASMHIDINLDIRLAIDLCDYGDELFLLE